MSYESANDRDSDDASDPALESALLRLEAEFVHGATAVADADSTVPGIDQADLHEARSCLRLLQRRWAKDRPGVKDARDLATELGSINFPVQFGRFLVERELGRGGFGFVYKAFDPTLRREVALKVPRPEFLRGSEAHQRFIREGQTAARLHHPNLVTVLEAGEVGSVCYLATEYQRGPTLASWLLERESPVPAAAAAEMIRQLAAAVGYMHAQGVIHRDIKPGNVLLGESSQEQPADLPVSGQMFMPKLTDFGLAKQRDDQQAATRTGAPLGTVAYMAPEQAAGDANKAGPAADVYSLGVLLYEMIAGKNPFQGASDLETLRRQTEFDAPSLRRYDSSIPRDLEAIVLKCLEKEPARRYRDAGALAGDLTRLLEGRPVSARPLGAAQRLGRWMRRHQALAAALGLSVILLLFAVGGFAWHSWRLGLVLTALEARQSELLLRAYVQDMNTAYQAVERERYDEASKILTEYVSVSPGVRDPRGPEWDLLQACTSLPKPVQVLPHRSRIWSIDEQSQGGLVATSEQTGEVHLWELDTGREIRKWQAFEGEANVVRFVPGKPWLLTGGQSGQLKIWSTETSRLLAEITGHEVSLYSIAFSPDGQWLATGARDKHLLIWRLSDILQTCQPASASREADSLPEGKQPSEPLPVTNLDTGSVVYDIAFSPDSKRVIVGIDPGFIVYDVEEGRELSRGLSGGPGAKLYSVRLMANGRWLAGAGYARNAAGVRGPPRERLPDQRSPDVWPSCVWIYDLQRQQIHDALMTQLTQLCVGVSRDEQWMASGGREGVVFLWKLSGGQLEHSCSIKIRAHSDEVDTLRFSRDGRRLLTGSTDGTVKIWDVSSLGPVTHARHLVHPSPIHEVRYSRDGRSIATAGDHGELCVIEGNAGQRFSHRMIESEAAKATRISPDLKAAVAVHDRTNRLAAYDMHDGRLLWDYALGADQLAAMVISADSRLAGLATRQVDANCVFVTLAMLSGRQIGATNLNRKNPTSAEFSPDGRKVLVGHTGLEVTEIDLATGKMRVADLGAENSVVQIAFSNDGQQIALGSSAGQLLLTDPAMLHVTHAQYLFDRPMTGLCFSSDNRLLAASSADGFVAVFHCQSRQVMRRYRLSPFVPGKVAFSPDQTELACAVSGDNFLGRSGVFVLKIGLNNL